MENRNRHPTNAKWQSVELYLRCIFLLATKSQTAQTQREIFEMRFYARTGDKNVKQLNYVLTYLSHLLLCRYVTFCFLLHCWFWFRICHRLTFQKLSFAIVQSHPIRNPILAWMEREKARNENKITIVLISHIMSNWGDCEVATL